jgi:hypothetical protein
MVSVQDSPEKPTTPKQSSSRMADYYQLRKTWQRSSLISLLVKLSRYAVMRCDLVMFPIYRGLVKKPNKPDFLVIGAQKAGTTWLHHILSSLPGVYVPEAKELHFFDRGFDWTVLRYLRHFRAEGFQGDMTPDYSTLDPATVMKIRRLFPDLKIIFIVREPLERAWSATRMELASQVGRNPSEVREEEMRLCLLSNRTISRSDYAATLDAWLAAFPQGQFLLLDYEKISDDPRSLIKQVVEFVGIEPTELDDDIISQRILEGEKFEIPERVLSAVEPVYERLRQDANRAFKRVGFSVAWRSSSQQVQ